MTGIALSAAVVSVLGFLSIQIEGLRGGAVFGLDNQLVAVDTPRLAVLQMAASVVLSCLVLVVLVKGGKRESNSISLFPLAFSLMGVAQVAVGLVRVQQDGLVDARNEPWPDWYDGWLQAASANPGVHLLLASALSICVRGAVTRHSKAETIQDVSPGVSAY